MSEALLPQSLTGKAAVFAGIGAFLPPRVVTNHDLSRRLDTSDEWIRTRTGIAQRHFVEPGMTTVDLAVEAGLAALKSAGETEVGAVVVATTTPDRMSPASAPEVAWRLGLSGVLAFDVAAVCTGFVYGLATCAGLISAGVADRVLLIGADRLSMFLDPHDRGTAILFGDGAGAVVLRAGDPREPGVIGPFDLGSDGEASDLISIPMGQDHHARANALHLSMEGREVYRRAVPRMEESSRIVLRRAGWDVAEVDRFVGHQANARILDAVADRLGIPSDRRVVNVDRVGNTAAASIPLALAGAVAEHELRAGHRVLLTAFGGGLTWGSTVLVWPEITGTGTFA